MPENIRQQLVIEFMQSSRSTGQLFYKVMQKVLQEKSDCTMASLPILKILKQQRSGLSQTAIAHELYHSDAAVSRQIKHLTEEGLVTASPDEHNRRAIIVKLTQKGRTLLGELETTITDYMTDILSEIPDKELSHLIDSNSRLQTIITSKLGKEPHV